MWMKYARGKPRPSRIEAVLTTIVEDLFWQCFLSNRAFWTLTRKTFGNPRGTLYFSDSFP